MRIYKYRTFRQWAKGENICDSTLKQAINEIEQGLFEAYFGNGLYKKRIARKGQGKRSGYRTLIALKQGEKAIFMYGYAKNERDNISPREERVYKKLSEHYLKLSDMELINLIKNGELFEVI